VRFIVLLLALMVLACSPDEPRTPEVDYLGMAADAGRWLQELEVEGFGIPDLESDRQAASGGLGSGAAGRSIFLAELFVATGDSSFLRLAEREVRRALASVSAQGSSHGLYRGAVGVGYAASEVASVLGDDELAEEVRRLFLRVASEALDRDGAAWGGVNDLLNGSAGIGLGLLYAHRELGDSTFLRAAITTGDLLLEAGEPTPDGSRRWLRGAERPLDLPNLSHGTAGVGFFLARLGSASGQGRFVRAAQEASDYLQSIRQGADTLYLVPYGVPNDGYDTPYDIGWAHGPAGTSLLHYALWKETGGVGQRELVDQGALTVLASGVPGASSDSTLWRGPFNTDRRFGTAGAAVFLFDWGQETERAEFIDRAFRMAEDIASRSSIGDGTRWWRVPLYAFQGDGDGTFTGYFYGAAGFGLALLRAHYASVGGQPTLRFPDDPFQIEGSRRR
jgi:hypothetical protein